MQTNTFNVVQLSISFFLIFFAFNSTSSILEFLIDSFNSQIGKHVGYNSLAILYGTFTVSNLFSEYIVRCLGTRYSMTLATGAFTIFQCGFIFLNKPYLYTSSILTGIAATILWTAQEIYLSKNSNACTAMYHTAIFWTIIQSSQIFSGLFLFAVFYLRNNLIDYSTIYIIFGVFTNISISGMLLLLSLRDAETGLLQYAPKISTLIVTSRPKYDHIKVMKSTFRLFLSRRPLLLVFVFLYIGAEQAFIGPIYSTCIGFTLQLSNNNNAQIVVLNLTLQGFGKLIGTAIFGILNKKVGYIERDCLVCFATLFHLIAYFLTYINFPPLSTLQKTAENSQIQSSIWIALTCSFIFGLCDACWNTQISSILITHFSHKSAEIFSLFKLFQTFASCFILFCSTSFKLPEHIVMLSVGCIIACACFISVEHFIDDENSNFYRENRVKIEYIRTLSRRSKQISAKNKRRDEVQKY